MWQAKISLANLAGALLRSAAVCEDKLAEAKAQATSLCLTEPVFGDLSQIHAAAAVVGEVLPLEHLQ